MSNHKQHGFAHVGLFALLVVVVCVAGFVGWRVWQSDQKDDTPSLVAPDTPCEGRLYDSHAHPDDDAILESLPETMTKYDVGCTVLFTQMNLNNVDDSLLEARERYGGMPGRISIFYDVIAETPSDVTREKLDELYEKSGGNFAGFGEFAFYEDNLHDVPLTDPGWLAIFEFASEKNLVVMIHPQQEMVRSLEEMLVRFPKTKVLVHGFELPGLMGSLLQKHANLYYTLDTATMLTFDSSEPGTPMESLFYPGNGPERKFDTAVFVKAYDAKKTQVLESAKANWLPVLLAAPDRVLWGTDISLEGHINPETYKRIINLTNTFLQEVPGEHRENYLRNNAFTLLGQGQTLQPPTDEELDAMDDEE